MKNKVKFKDKQRVSIFLPEGKAKELKIKAFNLGVSLSDLMSVSASDYNPNRQVFTKDLTSTFKK